MGNEHMGNTNGDSASINGQSRQHWPTILMPVQLWQLRRFIIMGQLP